MLGNRRVFDIFPFFDELDVLEIRLHELDSIVDCFIIGEAGETYGGTFREYVLEKNWERFVQFRHKIIYMKLPQLYPACVDRTSGRTREAYQRNQLAIPLMKQKPNLSDIVIFSDCDEIPRAAAIVEAFEQGKLAGGTCRLKQQSYYYNVNRIVDYGHDFASRARVAYYDDVRACNNLYDFRMHRKNTQEPSQVIENGGWHFGYFGGVEKIKRKVEALSPFLSEYKLFGDATLVTDIKEGRDLHHRRCELPIQFEHVASNDPTLPAYFLANRERFKHFTIEGL